MPKRKPRLLVIGSINMDLVLKAARVPQAGETLLGEGYAFIPGGKGANQAVAAARLGAQACLAGRIGADEHGARLKDQLRRQGVGLEFLAQEEGTGTGLAVVMVEAGGQNRILVYPGANMRLCEDDATGALEAPPAGGWDALLIQLEIPTQTVIAACRRAKTLGIPVFLDAGPARDFPLEKVRGVAFLSPNEAETLALTGIEPRTTAHAAEAARALARKAGAETVIIKMGEQGAYLYHGGSGEQVPAIAVRAVDTTAAGDAFMAALALRWLETGDPLDSVRFANLAGALAVTTMGAQPSLPSLREIEAFARKKGVRL